MGRERNSEKIRSELAVTDADFRLAADSPKANSTFSFLRTLLNTSGMVNGWGHSYSFCNDKQAFANLDAEIDRMLREYFVKYSTAKKARTRPLRVDFWEYRF